MHENRETSGTSRSNQDRDQSEKAKRRTAGWRVPEESDCAVIPVNLSNKEGQTSSEIGEEGRGPRRTSLSPTLTRHRAGNGCPKDWAVCVQRLGKGDGTDSLLCSTI
jgi:hypothetical protein